MFGFARRKLDEAKEFVQNHQTGIACTATALTMYAVFRNSNFHTREYIRAQRMSYNEIELENWILFDFLDAKNLRPEYFEFAKEKLD
jgi:hypothetical protein